MNFSRRLAGLQERMLAEGIDLVVYGSCQNFQYITGLPIKWRGGVDLMHSDDNVFVPQEGAPVLTLSQRSGRHGKASWIGDTRVLEKEESYTDLVKKVASDLDWRAGRIGVGEHVFGSTWIEVARSFPGARFRGASSLMDDLRMIKDPGEIEALRRVARLTENVMGDVIPEIESGITQNELSIFIDMLGRKAGVTDVSFPPTGLFIKNGSEPTPEPNSYPRDEGLVAGTSIALDVGFVLDGYCSDWGRSLYWGPVGEDIRKGYVALQSAVVKTVDKMYEGSMRVCDVFPIIEGFLDKDGYGDHLRARLSDGTVGHQIGVEVHENPWLKPDNMQELQEGMVMCLEPKLWKAGEYYLRVEDMVLIHKNRAEFLTNYDREQFQL
ncbi:MAG: Xaa-Pro peptidase family protein [Candidatus Bathyarchaeota archaeon]|jgi:Xaa-Pro aminopeptidase|nr:Xaa-Pro peptidase family protein [Candidatus Bathyarchaeota archaeon]MDP7207296.1 Xaa-Pro peptidase family protein [Candidatus Bathyarchaeota archaeon]MDP7443006.1 Xaa-Pro peptidase family protein [Candidatus Bathyarchaeota archaeon]|tara:strand:+ start:3988 stop:5130 length:1143 start_codon:yes stop_codon:yes gene_type:complete